MDNNIKNYIDRIVIFIDDADFKRAEEYCEKILDIDANSGIAYYYKLLIEFKCKTVDELIEKNIDINKSANFSKIIKYGDEKIVSEIENAKNFIYDKTKKQVEEKLIECKNSNSINDIKNILEKYESKYSDNLDKQLLMDVKNHLNELQNIKKKKNKVVYILLVVFIVLIAASIYIYKNYIVCKHLETYLSIPYLNRYDVYIDSKCSKCDEVLETVKVREARYILNQETCDDDLDIKFTELECGALGLLLHYEINYYGDYADSFDIVVKYDGKEVDEISKHFSWGKTISDLGIGVKLDTSLNEENYFILGDQNHVIEYTYHLYKINERARGTTDFRKTIATNTYTFNTKDYVDSDFTYEIVPINN